MIKHVCANEKVKKGLPMKVQKKNIILTAMCAALLILAVFAVVKGVEKLTTKKVDTAEGLALIKAEEGADIQEIENRIKRLDEQDRMTAEEKAGRTAKEIFEGSVIMGDSISEAFTEFDILNPSSVVAKVGVEINALEEELETAVNLHPKVIFLAYGMNDILATKGDTELFGEQYGELLEQLKERLPDTRIFVNSIFPVQQQEIAEEPAYEKLDAYNQTLKTLCDERQLTFIDNSDLVTDEYYESDGVHFKPEFYPLWTARMAEVAAL